MLKLLEQTSIGNYYKINRRKIIIEAGSVLVLSLLSALFFAARTVGRPWLLVAFVVQRPVVLYLQYKILNSHAITQNARPPRLLAITIYFRTVLYSKIDTNINKNRMAMNMTMFLI